jgi:hypothetical protein
MKYKADMGPPATAPQKSALSSCFLACLTCAHGAAELHRAETLARHRQRRIVGTQMPGWTRWLPPTRCWAWRPEHQDERADGRWWLRAPCHPGSDYVVEACGVAATLCSRRSQCARSGAVRTTSRAATTADACPPRRDRLTHRASTGVDHVIVGNPSAGTPFEVLHGQGWCGHIPWLKA